MGHVIHISTCLGVTSLVSHRVVLWESVTLKTHSVFTLLIAINGSADCLSILLGIFCVCWLGEVTVQTLDGKWS